MSKPLARLCAALFSVAVLAGLVGCPKAQENTTKTTGQANQAKGVETVELWTMQLKPTFETFIGGLLATWEKQHPNTHVTWVDLPASEIQNKTLTAAASGHAPDLVNLNPAFANKLAGSGALMVIPIDKATRDAYFEAAWQANTVAGQVVGIPWYLSTSVTLYNREIWQQAGLDVHRWPKNYRELGEASRVIKAKTKATGFMPGFGDRGHFMEVLAQEGVALLSPDGKHAAFNTPAAVAVVAFWTGLLKDEVISQEAFTQGHREAIDHFQAGQTAAFPAGPQFLNVIRQNSPELYAKLDVGPQIGGASGKVGVAVMNLVIPNASLHHALALDLAKFLTSGENQLAFGKLVPILPSIKSAANDDYFKPSGNSLEERARAIAAAQLQRAQLLVPPLPHQNELAKALDDAVQRSALGIESPEATIVHAAQDWDRVLATP